MGSPTSTSWTLPSGLQCPAGGSVTYGVAKVLTKILKPLVGKSPHHIHSTQDLFEHAKKVTLMPGECLISYDFTALFTSVPVDPAIGIIKELLEKDNTIKEKNSVYQSKT